MYFKDSYTNVSNLGGTSCFLRWGLLRFASCSKSNEVLSSNVDPLKTELLSSEPGYCREHPFRLLAPGLYLLPRLLVGALLFPWQLRWPFTDILPLLCRGPQGIDGAGLPLFNLFKTRSIILSVPQWKEHELFLNSSHFDILYLDRFVIWHCVLCLFPPFLLPFFPLFFFFFFRFVIALLYFFIFIFSC